MDTFILLYFSTHISETVERIWTILFLSGYAYFNLGFQQK